jgi:pantetheine-phosphate adenylyltransferase
MKIAVYPGSFDPMTNGHLDILQRSATTFDEVIVAVGRNSSKTPLFTPEERVALIEKSCTMLSNVRVTMFEGLLVDFVQKQGAQFIVKGLRAVSDFESEFQMGLANRKLSPQIETIFLMTSQEYLFLSSSIVKEVSRLQGDISHFVPLPVQQALEERFKNNKTTK